MGKHILVVDDEKGALMLIGIMLDKEGFQVLKAHDAPSAIAVLDQHTPDMIILDVMMPGMSGIDLCRVIRGRSATQDTPILMLSADRNSQSVIEGMAAGANDYLPKPILHHDLVAKVRSILDTSRN